MRVYVEDLRTASGVACRRHGSSYRSPTVNKVNLEFSVDSAQQRENSAHKIETLIAALERFRAGLAAEAELRAMRER